MDIQRTAQEIGWFEAARNVSGVRESADVVRKVGAVMPLPDADIAERTARAARWLLGFGKRMYLFLTPEIALVETMAEMASGRVEAIIAIPCDLEAEAKERLRNNLPDGIAAAVLEEPYFPDGFLPGNGMLVTCGYTGGGRVMTLPGTYRMVEHYGSFPGRKVFIPYVELERPARYDGWMEISSQKFDEKWRNTE